MVNLIFMLLRREPSVSASFSKAWKLVAPSTRMFVPVSGIRSKMREINVSRNESLVWSEIKAALVNCDRFSPHRFYI